MQARPRVRWGDLRTRVLSALVLAPVGLFCVWAGGLAWVAVAAMAAVGIGLEWVALCGARPTGWPGLAVPASLVASLLLMQASGVVPAMLLLALCAACLWLLTRRLALTAGIPYVGLPLVALLWLRGADGRGLRDTLFLVLVVWASDIGAYTAGRLLGGPKLAPRVSPGKTVSGSLGGLLAAAAVGLLPGLAFGLPGGLLLRATLIAAGLGAVSQAGDLMESAIKRCFGVKDSGRLIPGHGGLLDRLDGLLAAGPLAALLALELGRGVASWQ